MREFQLRLSAFSICWLRAYDFGPDDDVLMQTVVNLKKCPLVKSLRNIANAKEIDEIDSLMFDIRYQERSKLVRVNLLPFYLEDQNLGEGRQLSSPISVNLLLDIASGFGVFNLCLSCIETTGEDAYTTKEIGFLTRQWLLIDRLNIRLPLSDRVESVYIREVINYYYLQLHKTIWQAAKPDRENPLSTFEDFQDWLDASREVDPSGCSCIHKLNQLGLTRSIFPTSFGPIIDIWGIKNIDIDHFDSDEFSDRYSHEIAWIFTDGQRDNLGENLHNERQTKLLALFTWPNHVLYVNQTRGSLLKDHVHRRVENYGCLDVEIVRILEIINLQSAILHAFDSQLDQQLDEVSSLTAQDQHAVIRITEDRRSAVGFMRSFDFYNLFHTSYWEQLYARLLASPRFRLTEATNLVEMKSKRLDEEIQKAVIVQDRTRQQQEREQELAVLRGLHGLSLANDIQSNALLIINFVVSATASFGFTEILIPLLTRISRATPSFPEAFPLMWIGLNIGVFMLIAITLALVSNSLIQSKSQLVELEGRLNSPYSITRLKAYLSQRGAFEYFYLDDNDKSGYIRIRKPYGVLLLEFDSKQFYRYVLLWHRGKLLNLENMKRIYVDEDLKKFTG